MLSLHPRVLVLSGFVFASATGVIGCATGPSSCSATAELQVTPAAAAADHLAPSPQNQVQFVGASRWTEPAGCNAPIPNYALLQYATWTNPDPANIQISSARDATNGTAVCLGPANGAVTLTGAFSPNATPASTDVTVKTVTLTCR